jgi:hypothetical protein
VGTAQGSGSADASRIVTMIQMLVGVIAVGLLGKIVFAAMQTALQWHEDERANETDDRARGGSA